jgi:hypothetical protein
VCAVHSWCFWDISMATHCLACSCSTAQHGIAQTRCKVVGAGLGLHSPQTLRQSAAGASTRGCMTHHRTGEQWGTQHSTAQQSNGNSRLVIRQCGGSADYAALACRSFDTCGQAIYPGCNQLHMFGKIPHCLHSHASADRQPNAVRLGLLHGPRCCLQNTAE